MKGVRSMSFYSGFLHGGGLILEDFIQRKAMRIKATGIYRENDGIYNSTQNSVEREILQFKHRILHIRGTTRVLKKWRF